MALLKGELLLSNLVPEYVVQHITLQNIITQSDLIYTKLNDKRQLHTSHL